MSQLTPDEMEWLDLALKLKIRTSSDLDWERPDDPEVELIQGDWDNLAYQMKVYPLEDLRNQVKLMKTKMLPSIHE